MNLLQPSAEILFPISKMTAVEMVSLIESAARLCYKSEKSNGVMFDPKFIRSKIDMGHESIIEHSMMSVLITCDRGVSHEIVRHRLASYSQESTRYCNYGKDKFGNELSFIDIRPIMSDMLGKEVLVDGKLVTISNETISKWIDIWMNAMEDTNEYYMQLINSGCPAQLARSVTPASLKTSIIVTMNFREWRHFFKLRALGTTGKPHPQMMQIAVPLLDKARNIIPVIFDDLVV